MKRKLTQEEKENTLKGIKRSETQIKEIRKQLLYNQDILEFKAKKRALEDKWRPFLREQEDKADKNIIKEFEMQIKEKENVIEIMNKQLKEGVETKNG